MIISQEEQNRADVVLEAMRRWNRDLCLFPFSNKPNLNLLNVLTGLGKVTMRERDAAWETLKGQRLMEEI